MQGSTLPLLPQPAIDVLCALAERTDGLALVTVTQLADATGVHRNTVWRNLRVLKDEKLIERHPHRQRFWVPSDCGRRWVKQHNETLVRQ